MLYLSFLYQFYRILEGYSCAVKTFQYYVFFWSLSVEMGYGKVKKKKGHIFPTMANACSN